MLSKHFPTSYESLDSQNEVSKANKSKFSLYVYILWCFPGRLGGANDAGEGNQFIRFSKGCTMWLVLH